jgi:hypothetical protein
VDEQRVDRAAEDLRALHRRAVERALEGAARVPEAEAMPSFALRMSDLGTVVEETGRPGERGADPLFAQLFVSAAEGRLRATAVVSGIVMRHEETGVEHEAVAVDLEHRDVDPVTMYVLLRREAGGAVAVDRTVPTPGRRVVFADGPDA